jgi:four helix bundle protein
LPGPYNGKRMRIERFEDIEAWQLARELTHKVYDLTKKVKFDRDFGLRGQIQEAAGSSMHNIAEGFDSETNPEFVRFLRYAKWSCTEVQSELYVAFDQQYITNAEFQDAYDHAGRTFTLLGHSDRACCYSRVHPPAMRDLRIYGKNRVLGLFSAWVKKQIGVKA